MSKSRARGRGRIIHMIDGLGHGGAERLMTPILSGLAKVGYDVQVIALQNKDGNQEAERLKDHGVPVRSLPIDKLKRADQIAAALWALRADKPGLIHAHLQFSIILSGLARCTLGIPSVVTLHTDQSGTGFDRETLRFGLSNAFMNRCCDRVICLTEASKRHAVAQGLDRAPLAVLPNGIDLAPYGAAPLHVRAALRHRLGLAEDDTVLISVAVLRPEKGLDRLIAALDRLVITHPRLKLVIVGDGAQKEALLRQIARAGLENRVLMTGYRTDIPDLLAIADVFVLPTLADALPTVVIEAMASRLPVIASNVGGLPEMIGDDEGQLVPPDNVPALADAIAGVLRDDPTRLAMGARALDRAQIEFSIETQVARLSALYDTLMKPGIKR
ncbi:hypothetical protein C1J03_15430 [Sulfitobacter sp. SK012]|uniref:glycosyltransferase n=1 Tax=Sulfitobacter sp. SK012 TaxID=1389005 RepID=UPI000E0C30E7|nr:glycosyltransferase [Sulfitobacter sp. SK012]AXI47278.1 hypothetical protein C1J03_15430 [Sulfitobacter sp. SK012]